MFIDNNIKRKLKLFKHHQISNSINNIGEVNNRLNEDDDEIKDTGWVIRHIFHTSLFSSSEVALFPQKLQSIINQQVVMIVLMILLLVVLYFKSMVFLMYLM